MWLQNSSAPYPSSCRRKGSYPGEMSGPSNKITVAGNGFRTMLDQCQALQQLFLTFAAPITPQAAPCCWLAR